MKKDCHPVGQPGVLMNEYNAGSTNTCISPFGLTIINLPERAESHKDLRGGLNYVKACIAAHQSCSELDVYDASFGNRTRRGDSLKALRIVHRCYKKSTRLNLVSGIWVLCPVDGIASCTRYECRDRLSCTGVRP